MYFCRSLVFMIIIYNGDCEFCRNPLTWLERRESVIVLAYKVSDVSGPFGRQRLSLDCRPQILRSDKRTQLVN